MILNLIGLLARSLLVGQNFPGNPVLTLDPLTQVHELAPFATERTERIIFPID